MHRSTALRCLYASRSKVEGRRSKVEGRRSADGRRAAEPFAVRGLVGRLRNHPSDAAPTEIVADRPGRVRLVGQDRLRRGPGPADRPRHPPASHDLGECGCVTGLARREDEGEGPAAAVGGEVDLCGQSAAGPSDGMVVRLAGRGPF